MPLFKGLSSKSTPKKAIAYITREDKAAFVSVRNLFEDEDYAEQFADTMRRFGKAYFETEEGQREFAAWQAERQQIQLNKKLNNKESR